MKDRLIKLGVMTLSLIAGGGAYELISEVRQLQTEVVRLQEYATATANAFNQTSKAVDTLTNNVRTTGKVLGSTKAECSKAGGELVKLRNSSEEILKEIQSIKEKLRLGTKVFTITTDKKDSSPGNTGSGN